MPKQEINAFTRAQKREQQFIWHKKTEIDPIIQKQTDLYNELGLVGPRPTWLMQYVYMQARQACANEYINRTAKLLMKIHKSLVRMARDLLSSDISKWEVATPEVLVPNSVSYNWTYFPTESVVFTIGRSLAYSDRIRLIFLRDRFWIQYSVPVYPTNPYWSGIVGVQEAILRASGEDSDTTRDSRHEFLLPLDFAEDRLVELLMKRIRNCVIGKIYKQRGSLPSCDNCPNQLTCLSER